MSKRITKDLQNAATLKEHGIYIHFDDSNIRDIHALIVGPADSVYEGGLFFFNITLPEEYPFQPPKVKFLTYDGCTRFHPNLYIDGKVCLSILGTWHGPSWATTMSISTVLLSIQGLLDSDPMKHEPGWEGEEQHIVKKRREYAEYIEHRVLCYNTTLCKKRESWTDWQKSLLGNLDLGTIWQNTGIKAKRLSDERYTIAITGLPYGMTGSINWLHCCF